MHANQLPSGFKPTANLLITQRLNLILQAFFNRLTMAPSTERHELLRLSIHLS